MDIETLQKNVDAFNQISESLGLLPIAIVHPKDCKGQEKNARYFKPETFKQLVANIKKYGHLETVPLVYKEGDIYRTISGHHRIEAAVEAGLEWIMVFVDNPENRDEIVAKQLSHNALEGKDDPFILAELFNSIVDVNYKMDTGLETEFMPVNYAQININLLESKEMVLMFLPDDFDYVAKNIDNITALTSFKPDSEISVVPLKIYDDMVELIMKTKQVKNIKNNAVAFSEIIQFVASHEKEFLEVQ